MILYSFKNTKYNNYLCLNISFPLASKKFIRSCYFTPKSIITYNNSLSNKSNVLKENKGKSGIYRWVNKINNKSYVGGSVNLYCRFINYYSKSFLSNKLLITNSHIYRALLFHGHGNFNLEILEYCDKKFVIDREQYYIDLLNPEYNILRKAGSSLGFKHSPETLLKLKSRKLSQEALANLKKAKAGVVPSALTKINQLLATGHTITVVNKQNNYIKEYSSIRGAARSLGVNHATILNYVNNNKLLKGIYLITKK